MKEKKQEIRTECIRCGTCCEKGGPALHTDDKALVVEGRIHTRHLYTIRKGERVHDNVRDCLIPATSDIIKIKGKSQSWECVFFQEDDKTCEIYEQRPQECRILKCWDTREIESTYQKTRLSRRDVLAEMGELWELIQLHEENCSHELIDTAIQNLNETSGDQASETIIAAIQYDQAIRKLVTEQGQVTDDMLDFLFGRPLTQMLKNAGCRIEKINGGYRVIR
jgi:Fe-S-cluster containining protein